MNAAVPPPAEFMLEGMRNALEAADEGMPMIFLGMDEEAVMCPVIGMEAHEMLHLLAHAAQSQQIPPVRWIAMVSDTYRFRDTEKPEQPFNLAEMFTAGDERVEECLTAFCLAPDGPSYSVFQPYVHNEDGYTWGEIEDDKPLGQTSGRLLDFAREIVRAPAWLN